MSKRSWVFGGLATVGLASWFAFSSGTNEQTEKPDPERTPSLARADINTATSIPNKTIPSYPHAESVAQTPQSGNPEPNILGDFFRHRLEKCSPTNLERLNNFAELIRNFHNIQDAVDQSGMTKQEFIRNVRETAYRAMNEIPTTSFSTTDQSMSPLDSLMELNRRKNILLGLGLKDNGAVDPDHAKQMSVGYDFQALQDKMKEIYPQAREQAIAELKELLKKLDQGNMSDPKLSTTYSSFKRIRDVLDVTTDNMEYSATGKTSSDTDRNKGFTQENFDKIYTWMSHGMMGHIIDHSQNKQVGATTPNLSCS